MGRVICIQRNPGGGIDGRFVQRVAAGSAACPWLCHLALLIPMLGLSEHPHLPSDRYTLVVRISWSVLLAGMQQLIWPRRQFRRALIAVVAVIIMSLGVVSYRQTSIWQNEHRLFTSLGQRNWRPPHLAKFRFEFNERLAQAYSDKGTFPEAIQALRVGLTVRPDSAAAHYKLGLALTAIQDVDGAVGEFTQAVRIVF